MKQSSDALLARLAKVITTVFRSPEGTAIVRETTANDINGWDSLSHTALIMEVEDAFGIELPIEGLYALRNVGELADLIEHTIGRHTVLVYGNCQAEGVAQLLRALDAVTKRYTVLYVPSYDRPGGTDAVEREDVETCEVLFHQHDPTPFPYTQWLRDDCRRVTFPSLDLNLLWPFSRPNPYNEPELPDFPHGVFPYGHGVVVSAVERGLNAQDALTSALAEPQGGHRPNLDRLLKLEAERLRQRESDCDVHIVDYVVEHFRDVRLFWATNHPSNALFAELCARLLAAGLPVEPLPTAQNLVAALRNFGAIDLFGAISVPVDPWVADHFDLKWYDPDETYRLFNDEHLTLTDYYERMIAVSLAVKRRREAPAESVEIGVE